LIVVLVLAVFVLVPLLLFGIELVIVGVAIAAGIVGRVVLGSPWIVLAESADAPGVGFAWKVSGWRRSARLITEIADAMKAGRSRSRGRRPSASRFRAEARERCRSPVGPTRAKRSVAPGRPVPTGVVGRSYDLPGSSGAPGQRPIGGHPD
jgi:hypothetical protein